MNSRKALTLDWLHWGHWPASTPRPNLSPDSSSASILPWSSPREPPSTARQSCPSQSRCAMWIARVLLRSGANSGLQRLSTVFTPSSTKPAYGWRKDRHHTWTDIPAKRMRPEPTGTDEVRSISTSGLVEKKNTQFFAVIARCYCAIRSGITSIGRSFSLIDQRSHARVHTADNRTTHTHTRLSSSLLLSLLALGGKNFCCPLLDRSEVSSDQKNTTHRLVRFITFLLKTPLVIQHARQPTITH